MWGEDPLRTQSFWILLLLSSLQFCFCFASSIILFLQLCIFFFTFFVCLLRNFYTICFWNHELEYVVNDYYDIDNNQLWEGHNADSGEAKRRLQKGTTPTWPLKKKNPEELGPERILSPQMCGKMFFH